MSNYETIEITIKAGEIITLKKGMLIQSPLTGRTYRVLKARYLGNGRWEAIQKVLEEADAETRRDAE